MTFQDEIKNAEMQREDFAKECYEYVHNLINNERKSMPDEICESIKKKILDDAQNEKYSIVNGMKLYEGFILVPKDIFFSSRPNIEKNKIKYFYNNYNSTCIDGYFYQHNDSLCFRNKTYNVECLKKHFNFFSNTEKIDVEVILTKNTYNVYNDVQSIMDGENVLVEGFLRNKKSNELVPARKKMTFTFYLDRNIHSSFQTDLELKVNETYEFVMRYSVST